MVVFFNQAVDVNDPLDREKTVNATVFDLTAREMHIACGNPCENPYHTYRLDAEDLIFSCVS